MTDVVVPSSELTRRTIRRTDWVAENAAFIDCRTPGSDRKSNYAFIGPGVSQNAKQFINLSEPHGYNVGAAGMPNGRAAEGSMSTTITRPARPGWRAPIIIAIDPPIEWPTR